MAEAVTREGATRLGFLVTLKTFQRLGYFVPVQEVPVAIVEHIARCLGYLFVPVAFVAYDRSRVRKVHLETIRTKLGVRPYPVGGAEIVTSGANTNCQLKGHKLFWIKARSGQPTMASYSWRMVGQLV